MKAQWISSIKNIDKKEWNSLAENYSSPYLDYTWLFALEESKSISPRNGWSPRHLTLWDKEKLIAIAPLYIKTHSQGEFVWDYFLVQIARELNIPYYPKLVGMVPATPCRVYSFLISPSYNKKEIIRIVIQEIKDYITKSNIRSINLHYLEPQFYETAKLQFNIDWKHQSYVWENKNYSNFEDYLQIFKKNQRRNIRREIKSLHKNNINIKYLEKKNINQYLMDKMFFFYTKTNDRFGMWAARFLFKDFFKLLLPDFRENLLLIAAYKDNTEPVALSFFVKNNEYLFGRYWGAESFISNLHFNLCYYKPIEWAIKNKIRFFDPGIGGTFKVRRGFLPVYNHSLHYYSSPIFQNIMENNIDIINSSEEKYIQKLLEISPLKKG